MRLVEEPRSISADAARAGGKDCDLGFTVGKYIDWQIWIAASNTTQKPLD